MLETRFSLLFQQKLETSLHRLKRIKEEKKNALQLSTLMEPIANSPAESLTCTIFLFLLAFFYIDLTALRVVPAVLWQLREVYRGDDVLR